MSQPGPFSELLSYETDLNRERESIIYCIMAYEERVPRFPEWLKEHVLHDLSPAEYMRKTAAARNEQLTQETARKLLGIIQNEFCQAEPIRRFKDDILILIRAVVEELAEPSEPRHE